MEIYTVKLYTSCVRFKKVRNIFVPRCSIALRYSLVLWTVMNGLWMVYEWIVNAYEWICIRLFYIVILHRLQQTLSPSATDKVKPYQLQKLSKQWNKIAVPPSPQNGGKTIRLRIGLVSFPYRSRINPVSFSYRPPIVLLSFSLPEAETIRKRYGNNRRSKGETRENAPNSKHFQIFKTLQLWQDSMVS